MLPASQGRPARSLAPPPIPATDDDTTTLAAAFLIGVSAMWISDILFEFIVRKFKPIAQE
ncbi:hypothetical protein [Mesorhizobium sp.]|uniref:hypothetical protein n=1 Tax=Mesorhizobium sp. TaxID=1871066 RepID=UPI00338DD0E9